MVSIIFTLQNPKLCYYRYHVHFLKDIMMNFYATEYCLFCFRKKFKETTKRCFKNWSQQSCVIFTEFSTADSEEPSLRIINTTDEIFGETKSVRPSVGRSSILYYYFKVCVLLTVVACAKLRFEIGKSPRARNSRAPSVLPGDSKEMV